MVKWDTWTPEGKCFKGKKVEVLSASNNWRKAEVVQRLPKGVMIHYEGYDSEYDEVVGFNSKRLREFGSIRRDEMHALKTAFVNETKAGTCPGCGVQLQCEDRTGIGYILPEKMQPSLAEDSEALKDKSITLDEEVAFLLEKDGRSAVGALDVAVAEKAEQNRKYKVVQNIYLDVRVEPDIDAERVEGESLRLGEEFEVSEIRQGPELRNYLRLADGRGWVFDWATIQGVRVQLVKPLDDGIDLVKAKRKKQQMVCQRCWGLWQYNDIDDNLRPGFHGSSDDISPKKFEDMLNKTLRSAKKGLNNCILCVVDVFDMGPSMHLMKLVSEAIEGRNDFTVRIIGNKTDLLPIGVPRARLLGWISRQAREAGLKQVKVNDVNLLSCIDGIGVKSLSKWMADTTTIQAYYLVGAANAGKSSLLNRLALRKRKGVGRNVSTEQDGFTVSSCPGTTLEPTVVIYERAGQCKVIDTPGLLPAGSYATYLPYEDLKLLVPQKKQSLRFTLAMAPGKSIMLGGLARIDMVDGERKTFTMNTGIHVRVHRCSTSHAEPTQESLIEKGLNPPLKLETYQKSLPWKPHRFELDGWSRNEACADIVFPGLGWVAVSGTGPCTIEAWAPEGIEVTLREDPLLPFEARHSGMSYEGHMFWFSHGGRTTRGLRPTSKPVGLPVGKVKPFKRRR